MPSKQFASGAFSCPRPDGTKYHRRGDIEFGETLHIPEPFGVDLVTSDLLPY
jgi:hypothetical protein